MEDQPEQRRVLVLPGSTLVEPWTVCSFPCARRLEPRQVLLYRGGVAELSRVQRPLGSWFIDESVEGHGGVLHIASDMDPMFLLLPLLSSNLGQFRPFGDMVADSPHRVAYAQLVAAEPPGLMDKLRVICDVKEIPGLDSLVFRLNEERTLRWLLCKVDNVVEAVQAGVAGRSAGGSTAVAKSLSLVSGPNNGSSSSSSNGGCVTVDPSAALQTAVDVVCEYLSPHWVEILYRHFGLTQSKRDGQLQSALFAAQNRVASNGSRYVEPAAGAADDAAAAKRESTMTVGQKRMRKVDTKGMASLASFFPKKSKSQQEADDDAAAGK